MSSVAKSSVSINEYILFFFFSLRNQGCTANARKAAAKYISPRWLHPKLTRSLVWISIYASPLVLESNLVMLRQSGFNFASIWVRWCTTSRIRALNLEWFKNTSFLDLELAPVSLMSSSENSSVSFMRRMRPASSWTLQPPLTLLSLFLPKYKREAIKIAVLNPILWLCEIWSDGCSQGASRPNRDQALIWTSVQHPDQTPAPSSLSWPQSFGFDVTAVGRVCEVENRDVCCSYQFLCPLPQFPPNGVVSLQRGRQRD